MTTKINRSSWTEAEDNLLAQIMIEAIRTGEKKKKCYVRAAKAFNRSVAACVNRWSRKHQEYLPQIQQAEQDYFQQEKRKSRQKERQARLADGEKRLKVLETPEQPKQTAPKLVTPPVEVEKELPVPRYVQENLDLDEHIGMVNDSTGDEKVRQVLFLNQRLIEENRALKVRLSKYMEREKQLKELLRVPGAVKR